MRKRRNALQIRAGRAGRRRALLDLAHRDGADSAAKAAQVGRTRWRLHGFEVT
jgi:hypothetical protein